VKQKKKWLIPLTAAAIVLAGAALDPRLKTVTYVLQSPKISAPVRLAVVADLHGCRYGEDMGHLLSAVQKAAPDAVLIPGDFFDDDHSMKNTRIFARAIAAEYPTFYVSGNHEIASKRSDAMKEELRSYGITVLEGDAVPLALDGVTVWIAGADDPLIGRASAAAQRKSAREAIPAGAFGILLSHRPELSEEYAALGFDAVVSGHAHGGQWRIPLLLNGLLAPHQGLFPDYAGGMYDLGTTTLIVSRGLARETTWVPRIFNRPELVIINIQ